MFRVQKLLLAEYEEIYEPVMIESPFTLVDANGQGLCQYQVALTGSKLLFGSDNFDKHEEQDEEYDFNNRGLDPEIECFDLISMMPLEYVRFNFYRKRDRCQMMLSVQHLETQLRLEHPMIFEFGGHIHKQYYWHTWRERVAMLRCYQKRFSHITGASPFSSSDVQLEQELHHAQVHVPYKPQSVYSLCHSSAG
ncbi:uncharacterized protein LOC117569157 [Drosophila albomicans]|uniref:Uncharacterized protein LOC117569157 n=1 Tax=Drosophila albomicans TaxID=7291 RepID=A0A6P8YFC6_DROAB|nr:uncharacterized protein LOC117569157 [Drosophila albomicans]